MHVHAASLERHVFEDLRGLRVLAGQHAVAAAHQRDLGTERVVEHRELGSGHTDPDDDEVLGNSSSA